MMQARQPIKKGRKLGKVGKELQGFGIGVLESSIKLLEGAIEEAKESNIGVDKARRLLKELQAQAAAVEAANHLDSIMAKKPCGSGVLRVRITCYCFPVKGALLLIEFILSATSAMDKTPSMLGCLAL